MSPMWSSMAVSAATDAWMPGKGRADESMLDAAAIAECYLALHRQTSTAWSHEIDLRPRLEAF